MDSVVFFLNLTYLPRLATVVPGAVKYRKFKITFQFTHLSSCHPSNCKKGFVKGEALRLLRTNSVRENFEQSKRDLRVKFTDRKEALRNKTKQTKEILPFVNTYNPATPNRKKSLMKHWDIIQQQPISFKHIFNQPTIVFHRKEKISQGHSSQRENSFNLATITKSTKRLKAN